VGRKDGDRGASSGNVGEVAVPDGPRRCLDAPVPKRLLTGWHRHHVHWYPEIGAHARHGTGILVRLLASPSVVYVRRDDVVPESTAQRARGVQEEGGVRAARDGDDDGPVAPRHTRRRHRSLYGTHETVSWREKSGTASVYVFHRSL
jgi:hypothetical protein